MNPFESLEQHYPDIIRQMGKKFTSHEFILRLARQHQSLYIQALYQHVNEEFPFQKVHKRLVNALFKFNDLVSHEGQTNSEDIFGQDNPASLWMKR